MNNYSTADVRRTPGGLPYRVSRSSTPDIEYIKRNVEIENRKEVVRSAPSELFLRSAALSNPRIAGHFNHEAPEARDSRPAGPAARAVRPQTARESASSSAQHFSRRPHTARPQQAPFSNSTGRPASGGFSRAVYMEDIENTHHEHQHQHETQHHYHHHPAEPSLGGSRRPHSARREHVVDLSTAKGRFTEAIRATRPPPTEVEMEETAADMLAMSIAHSERTLKLKQRKHQPMGRSKPTFFAVASRFDEMIRSGWAMPDRSLEDALHSDLRKGLATAKSQMGILQQELNDWRTKFQILEEGCQVWVDRCKGLEESLDSKEYQSKLLDRENQKLLFLIGVREGEIANLMREVDHMRDTRDQTGRDEYEIPPGGFPRPSSPFFNDIDSSAVKLNKELVAVEADLKTRMKLVDNMDVMVAQVSAETKRRVEYEASRRPVFVDQAVQTHCGLGDMELLCAINEEPPPDEDPVDTHSRIMSVAKRRRFQPGVPLAFQGCVMDSRAWQAHKQQRLEQQTVKALQHSILSIYFSKRDTDNADDLRSVPRISLPQFILELYLSESSLKSDCDLRIMDLIGGVVQHAKHPKMNMFARLCGMSQTGIDGKSGHALPLETLNYFLQVLHLLHEMMAEQVRRARMTPKERSETPPRSDAELFASKGQPFNASNNVFVNMTRSEERISFKKAQVCKVIKECMDTLANSQWTEADNLPFVEANRLMNLDEALGMAIEVYEPVRLKRRETLAKAFSVADVNGLKVQLEGRGRPSFSRFFELVQSLDSERSKQEVMRLYREICVGSGTADPVLDVVACDVLQAAAIDRPKPEPKELEDLDPRREGSREGIAGVRPGQVANGGRVGRDAQVPAGAQEAAKGARDKPEERGMKTAISRVRAAGKVTAMASLLKSGNKDDGNGGSSQNAAKGTANGVGSNPAKGVAAQDMAAYSTRK